MAKKRKITTASGSTPVTPKQSVVKEEPKTEEKQQETPTIANPSEIPNTSEVGLNQEEVEKEEACNSPNEDTEMARENEDGGEEQEEDEESDPESIQNLLEVFPKDQLVEMLRDAALAHRDIMDQVRQAADMDPTQRKVFVHGLGWDTTTETLTTAFSSYGEIEDLKVVMDKNTGKCKGYGFVLFSKRSGAKNALREPQKKIGNRMAACQLASVGPTASGPPGPGPQSAQSSEYTQRKIFVSNVGPEVDPQKLLQFFAKFGEIEEGPLGLDKATGKPKGFALFVYKSAEGSKRALKEPHKKFEGCVLHCQKAIDGIKSGNNKPGFGKNHGSGFPGRNPVPDYAPPVQVVPAGIPGTSHLMAPPVSQTPVTAVAGAGLNPALGQALTAFLATQLGALGQGGVGSAGPNAGYGYGAPGSGYGGPGVPPQQGGSGRGGTGGYMGGI